MVPVTRRTALHAICLAVLPPLSGCSLLSSQSAMLDVAVFNHSDSPYTIELSMFRNDNDSSSRGELIYDERINVEPQGEIQQENVIKDQPYLVRYSVYEENSRQTDEGHVHYYPEDSPGESFLALDINSTGELTRR